MKIAALISQYADCRFATLLAEGLIEHPDVEVSFANPVIVLNKCVAKGDMDFNDRMMEADYIIRPRIDRECDKLKEDPFTNKALNFFDKHNLWHKTIAYDPGDGVEDICEETRQKAMMYVKKNASFVWRGGLRIPFHHFYNDEFLGNIFPSNSGVLSAYMNKVPANSKKRDIDVATFYQKMRLLVHNQSIPDSAGGMGYSGRLNIFTMLNQVKWEGFNNMFEVRYGHKPCSVSSSMSILDKDKKVIDSYSAPPGKGDAICSDDPDGTGEGERWIDFHNNQARSKIIFTCWPTEHGVDNRTWEALASGAYVFVDIPRHPIGLDLKHKKYCYIYNAYVRENIVEAIKYAADLLIRNDKERVKVAEAGRKYVWNNHRGIHRVDAILKGIDHAKSKRCYILYPRATPSIWKYLS